MLQLSNGCSAYDQSTQPQAFVCSCLFRSGWSAASGSWLRLQNSPHCDSFRAVMGVAKRQTSAFEPLSPPSSTFLGCLHVLSHASPRVLPGIQSRHSLGPSNTPPHVLVTPTIKGSALLRHYYSFATARNRNVNMCVFPRGLR